MKMKVEEIKPRASEGDIIELEGKVSHAQKPNEGEFGWSQFIGVKDDTGEQNCWLKLDSEKDRVSKGSSIKIKGKLSEEYKDKKSGKMVRSINNCEFEGDKKEAGSKGGNGAKEEYWNKKFEWERKRDIRNQLIISRECAFKAATELVCSENVKEATFDKIFTLSDKIRNHYFKDQKITNEEVTYELGGTTKEEHIEKAREAVGETEFRPATTAQKNKIFGYKNEKGWHKGIIESRYIKKEEIREIGPPEKLSVEKASEKLSWWWGVDAEVGERGKREIEAQDDSPIGEHIREEEPTIKGDKTSLTKDILVDEVNALRRENFLGDDEKFRNEIGYNPILGELSEEDLLKIKEKFKNYHPKSWNGEEE